MPLIGLRFSEAYHHLYELSSISRKKTDFRRRGTVPVIGKELVTIHLVIPAFAGMTNGLSATDNRQR